MNATVLFGEVERATNIEQELKALKRLEEYILGQHQVDGSQSSLDEEYLHDQSLKEYQRPETVFSHLETLNKFVCYVFMRRFGWSEVSDGFSAGKHITDPEHKSQINEILGHLLHWFHDDEPSDMLLRSLIFTLKQAQTKPVVRNQTVVHIMDLLRQTSRATLVQIFHSAKPAIILSLTDVWSPIRSACISRLGHVIEHFTIQQLQTFFFDLIDICRSSTSTWQAKEGAVMGVHTVIRKFQWIGILPENDVSGIPGVRPEENAKCEFILKFGSAEFTAMPEFISLPLEEVIYALLANTQLSIRENAIKCYAAYLGRCELKVAVRTFIEIVSKLNPGNADTKNEAMFLKYFTYLSDYEAEGLLGVCIPLVKQIPSDYLLPLWPSCCPVFSMYLAHMACTVRQVSSTLFKFVVAKNSSQPDVLKLVLHGLCSHWIADLAFLSCDFSHQRTEQSPLYAGIHSRITLKKWLNGKRDADGLTQVWEWREGRLLAYELILQFLIKNHWLYTFGSANLALQDSENEKKSENVEDAMDRFGKLFSMFEQILFLHSSISSNRSHQVLHHSLKGRQVCHKFNTGRRSSCSSPVLDVCVQRQRTSSESSHSSSQPSDVSHFHRPQNDNHTHHRVGSMTSQSTAPDSTHDIRTAGRMTTVYGCSSTSIKSYGRHYSYYTKSEETGKPDGTHHTHTACSLLAICLYTENQRKLTSGAKNDEVHHTHGKEYALAEILKQILLQCIECTADARWELRRMGQQLLPCIIEVIRWYDIVMVEDFLNTYLNSTTSLLTYGGCVCLMHSLTHVARLQWLLQEPPTSWQDVHLCQQLIHSIISCIRHRLSDWLKIVLHLLERPVIDQLTVVSMETIMIALGNFDLHYNEKCLMTKSVVRRLFQIYAHYHPSEKLANHFKCSGSDLNINILTEGFLSFRVDATSQRTTPHVEKYILTQINAMLCQFTEGAPLNEVVMLLPVIAAWIGFYTDDDTLLKHLIACVFCLCSRISLYCDNNENIDKKVIQGHCTDALQQLIDLILNKSTDYQSVRQVLDLCLAFLRILPLSLVVNELLHATASRLISESKPCSASSRVMPASVRDLYLQSNDVSFSTSHLEETPPSDDDDHLDLLSDSPMPETQMLNVSGNSGHSRRSRCNSGDDCQETALSDDDSSDWDDWDNEEEEDISGLENAIREFLTNLQTRLDNMKQHYLLKEQLRQLTEEKRIVLQGLIH